MHLHWDGDNDSVDERNLSAGLGAGITPVTVDHAGAEARARLDLDAAAAALSVSDRPGAGRARRGASTGSTASQCHADHRFRDGVKDGRSRRARSRTSIAIGTDRHRLDSYTDDFAANQYALFPDSPYRFTRFRKTHGYANQPLDGIWLRAPVPAQRLGADAARSARTRRRSGRRSFYRGYDVFDQARVGFVSDVAAGRRPRSSATTPALPATATAGTCTARRCPTPTRRHRRVPEDLLRRGRMTMINAHHGAAAGSGA